MTAIKTYFEKHDWPWYALSILCIILACLLLFRGRPGCADVVHLNTALSELDASMTNCCRCNERTNDLDEVVSNEEIDQRRSEAGGNVGALSISLAWNSTDDLDLMVVEPNGNQIWFKKKKSATGGHLDIDQNAEHSLPTNSPVENVYWASPPSGSYEILIWLYERRATANQQAIPITLQIKQGETSDLKNYLVNGNEESILKRIPFTYPN